MRIYNLREYDPIDNSYYTKSVSDIFPLQKCNKKQREKFENINTVSGDVIEHKLYCPPPNLNFMIGSSYLSFSPNASSIAFKFDVCRNNTEIVKNDCLPAKEIEKKVKTISTTFF